MPMFPIFIIGILAGMILTCVWYNFKKDTPSEVKVRLQDARILQYQTDIEILKKDNDKLRDELIKLKTNQQNV